MTPAELPINLIQSARFFHTSGITQAISYTARETVFAAIDVARAANVSVSFDANIRPRLWSIDTAQQAVKQAMALSDIFFLSLEDAAFLGAPSTATDILKWCHDTGAGRTVLKLAAEGVIASDGEQTYRISGHAVKSVDATGAGDCFAGALLARLAQGDDFPMALRYANAAAALTTTGFGAVVPIPYKNAVDAFLE